MTQQNAALVEQAAAAAESLRAQSQQLVQAVSVFRLAPASPSAMPAFARIVRPSTTPASIAASPAETARSWDGAERRGADRATNVARLPKKPDAPAAARPPAADTGTDGEWESF
jgi:hypothetical protein